MRAAFAHGGHVPRRSFAAPIPEPVVVRVGRVEVRVDEMRAALRALGDTSSGGGTTAEVLARQQSIVEAFRQHHGGAGPHEAGNVFEEHYRSELRTRFGVTAAAVYTSGWTGPVVVQAALPDGDGTVLGIRWEAGHIQLEEGALRAARLQRIRTLVGWTTGARPIEGNSIRRAYGERRFFAVDAGPVPVLVAVDPAAAGRITPDGAMRLVRGPRDLAGGLGRACSPGTAAEAAAAAVPLTLCGPAELHPDDMDCIPAERGLSCTATTSSPLGQRRCRVLFDEEGRLAATFQSELSADAPAEAQPWVLPPPCGAVREEEGERAPFPPRPQVEIVETEEAFRALCPTGSGVDFRRSRLALVHVGLWSSEGARFERATRDGDGVRLGLVVETVVCQGVEPSQIARIVPVLLPAARTPVTVAARRIPGDCGPVP